ncbi:MAG: succinyl-diaminopimelate desuccinylase [Albidovulum sp.]|nr:succinyl-diaminopimelate desuccinylase [Albidovulum sp.]
MNRTIDPVILASELVQCVSITPEDGGAICLLESVLRDAGFRCERADRNGIANLFARWDGPENGRTIGFNGHTDVVPPGDPSSWKHDPFGGKIREGLLWGRGSTDMKSAVAAFVSAAIEFVQASPEAGSIAIAITSDEEGPARDGTLAILDFMERRGEKMDACIVGEPTSREKFGDTVKIGRRGAMTAEFVAKGVQGHSAYPEKARNPLPAMACLAARLSSMALDEGSDFFDPSTLALTSIDTNNAAKNVIPESCRCTANIRFNDRHSSTSLQELLDAEMRHVAKGSGIAFSMSVEVSGESFIVPPGPLARMVANAVDAETGIMPEFSTSGGTSDARFIKNVCPVVEFGMVGKTMHQVDECASVEEIYLLQATYARILSEFFN